MKIFQLYNSDRFILMYEGAVLYSLYVDRCDV